LLSVFSPNLLKSRENDIDSMLFDIIPSTNLIAELIENYSRWSIIFKNAIENHENLDEDLFEESDDSGDEQVKYERIERKKEINKKWEETVSSNESKDKENTDEKKKLKKKQAKRREKSRKKKCEKN